jgi:ABC-type nitrate/sulfonate/bicarbonate transport system permease component
MSSPTPRQAVTGWVVLALALLGWETAARLAPSRYFPPFSQVLVTFQEVVLSGKVVAGHLLPSLRRMAIGYLLAVFVGITVGGILGTWRAAFHAVEPILEFLRAIPPPVLLPFTLLLFGLGDAGKICVIAFGCLWPILLNAMDGTRNVSETFKDTARLFGRTRAEIAFQVVVPAALPQVFAGMRTSVSLGLIMIVISEMIASSDGIGYLILHAQRTFDVPAVYSGILLLGLLGYGFNTLFLRLEGAVLHWHRGYAAKRI